jgi:NAD(P)-dependent dehydrogenase (short-subunit alcohol dehydrogenase family)
MPSHERLLVVGASSGIGRAIAVDAAARGMRVVAAARTESALVELARESGDRIAVLGCDVTVPKRCDVVVAETVELLGGLDAVIYASGITTLIELARATSEDWQQALATNLLGAASIATAAMPHLTATGGRLLCLSSDISVAPRYGLAIYAATKGGLDQLMVGLRLEHPEVGIASVRVGPTIGTSIHLQWDPEAVRRIAPHWKRVDVLTADVVAGRIVDALVAPELPVLVDVT